MTTPTKICLLITGLLTSLTGLSLAQAPSGQVNVDFNSAGTAVWDLSGHYPLEQQMLVSGGNSNLLAFGVDVVQTPAGALTGSGLVVVNIGGDTGSFFAANYTVQGKVSGGAGHPARATFAVRLSGEDIVAGVDTSFGITIQYDLQVTNVAGRAILRGTSRGGASFNKLGSTRVHSDIVPFFLPSASGGNWSLQLNVASLGNLSGTGFVVLSDGLALPVQFSGGYSSSARRWVVKATGIGDGRGTSVSMNFIWTGDQAIPTSVNGRILGQTVRGTFSD
jgi:hypothetical protein